MNREIKFRGRNYDEVWMYGYLMPAPKPQIHPSCKHVISLVPHTMKSVDRGLYEVDEDTIGQFTGVYDRMNHPIYEGDVLKFFHGEYKALVLYDNFRGFFCLAYEDSTKYSDPLNEETICGTQFEIIGNIHDNPELLKKGKE